MALTIQVVPTAFGLAAVFSWGSSDFLGGFASRRANAYFLTAISHAGGLALFYSALATGQMGLTAAVAAVVGAAIPAVVGIFVDGLPGALALAGFVLAAIGIWLIARPDGRGLSSRGLATAVVCGVGFACFYIFSHRAGDVSAFWTAACSRFAALVVVSGIVLAGSHVNTASLQTMVPARVGMGIAAGMLDVSGTICFIRAAQLGRLDSAVMLTSLYPAT